jgi:hypothetical protein
VYDESHGKPFLRDAFIDVTLQRRPPAICILAISIPAGSAIPCDNWPSGKGPRTGLDRHSVEKIFQRFLSGQMRRAM